MKLTFKKLSNRWFIDIPYDGDISDLEMVSGADLLLQSLPDNTEDRVINIVSNKTDYELRKLDEDELGGTYFADTPNYKGEVWLCNVTKLVLGKFPPVINFEV